MILEQIKKAIRRHNLIAKGDKVLIGVSGGPDSVALLYLLNKLKKEFKLTLHIAHLDHMLRKDSYRDAEFVKRLAERLKIPSSIRQVNVKELAKKGSLEEIARNARLAFLFKIAKDVNADKIALGHNLDDQAETVLMRIIRGTGLYGLSGILPKRNIAGYEIIRPLLEVKRKDIEAFLKRKAIEPCIDMSNLEDIYFRNRIRNKLLPLLEKEYNKNIKEVLANMAESLGYDYDYLAKAGNRASRQMRTKINLWYGISKTEIPTTENRTLRLSPKAISLKKLSKLHPALQKIIFRYAIASLKGNTRRITFQHIKEIEDLFLNRPINSIVDLPQGVSVIKKKNYLSFYRKI